MQMGLSALYRLYRTKAGWLCIAVTKDNEWQALCAAAGRPELALDPRFASVQGRRINDAQLVATLEPIFLSRDAAQWFDVLDRAGVPCEVSSSSFSQELFDDPDIIRKQWIASYPRAEVAHLEEHGLLIDFSETPGKIWGPAALCGENTCEILAELGYAGIEIDKLCADRVVLDGREPGAGAGITRAPRKPKAASSPAAKEA
jgi:crotonobetainyl-CoA:carnitine CoA-transferase CaiB-like acyl-CoA transferase